MINTPGCDDGGIRRFDRNALDWYRIATAMRTYTSALKSISFDSYSADDIAQDVIVNFWNSEFLSRWQPPSDGQAPEDAVIAMLKASFKRKAIDHIRRDKRVNPQGMDILLESKSETENRFDEISMRESLAQLLAKLTAAVGKSKARAIYNAAIAIEAKGNYNQQLAAALHMSVKEVENLKRRIKRPTQAKKQVARAERLKDRIHRNNG